MRGVVHLPILNGLCESNAIAEIKFLAPQACHVGRQSAQLMSEKPLLKTVAGSFNKKLTEGMGIQSPKGIGNKWIFVQPTNITK